MSDPFVGEIRMYSFNFARSGWAFCDGRMIPLAQNTALFAVLGFQYGGSVEEEQFALPDLRGRAPLGAGQGQGLSAYALGERGGVAQVSLDASQMPPHSHAMTASNTPALNSTPDGTQRLAEATARVYAAPGNLVAMQTSLHTGGQPHDNRQPYLGLHFVIALQGVFPTKPFPA